MPLLLTSHKEKTGDCWIQDCCSGSKNTPKSGFHCVFALPFSWIFSLCLTLMDTRRLLQFCITSFKAKTTTKKVIFVLCLFYKGTKFFPRLFFNPYSVRLLFITCWLKLGYLPTLNEPLAKDNVVIKSELD